MQALIRSRSLVGSEVIGRSQQILTSAKSSTTHLSTDATATADTLSKYLKTHINDHSLLQTSSYVNGEFVTTTDATFEVTNPATGEILARVSTAKALETRTAIAAASAVFEPWSRRPGRERAEILQRWHTELLQCKDDIAKIMTLECGKTLTESRNELSSGLESITWCAEEAKRVQGDVLPIVDRNRRFLTMKQPVGVVGAICPWNFPFSMITRKVSPALAAGCTVVLKPSELTPLTALAMAVAADRAELPRGVLNVVVGDAKSIGDELLKSEAVRKIGFTGSTAVGKMLYAGAANTVKRLSLELGGNAPFIVFDDADVDKAAQAVALSSYRNSGQTCICTNRVFVQEGIYDAFNKALVAKVSKMHVGAGIDASTRVGPLITAAAVSRVEEKVRDAVERGATVAVGGKRAFQNESNHPLKKGYYYEPTVITDATIDMKVFSQEIFGPVTPVFRFSKDEEAIQLANNTEYGLAAYFWTNNLSRAFKTAEALQYGMIGVNEVAITSVVAPFGGVKESGLGRENSKYALDEFLNMKSVCMGI